MGSEITQGAGSAANGAAKHIQGLAGSGIPDTRLPRANGEQTDVAGSDTSEQSANRARQAFEVMRNLNAGLGETVTMLLRDPKLRHLSLSDLERLVLSALTANQILTLRGKVKDKDGQENGPTVPLCLALWAKVSEEVDQKLDAQQKAGAPLRLASQDWPMVTSRGWC
ncbi:hypothetical protein WNZ15_25175 [Roseibium sp. AS2]|uniref:hypothetical protein n=1 Tax=Roseibium sp. AS2 TaxID=3135781 RepID=UPI003173A991